MANHSVYKAYELAHEERMLVERLLGRPVSSDETISVNAYPPHSAPIGDDREILRREILTQAEEISLRAQNIPEEDIDALLDEAFAAVRLRRA